MDGSARLHDVSTREGLIAFYDGVFAEVYRLAVRVTGGQRQLAEDLVQEGFLRLVRAARAGQVETVGIGWMVTTVRRLHIDALRLSSREDRRLRLVASTSVEPGPPTDSGETVSVLDRLSDRERTALALRYVEELSVKEIADLLGSTVRATESLLQRAKHKARLATTRGDRMNEPWIDELRAMAERNATPRPEFRVELRDLLEDEWETPTTATAVPANDHRHRWWILGSVAAAVLVVAGLVAVSLRHRDSGPATVPDHQPTTISTANRATVAASTSITLSPTATQAMTAEPSTTTPSATVTVPVTTVIVPSRLDRWPARPTGSGSVDDVTPLLPTETVPGTVGAVRTDTVADREGPYDYTQTFYDTNRGGYLVITTNISQASPAGTEFRTAIDTASWGTAWNDAYFVTSPPGRAQLELVTDGGFVQLTTLGYSTDELIVIARSLRRRPTPQAGWQLSDPPPALHPFADSGTAPHISRSITWSQPDGTPLAQLRITSDDAEALTIGWPDHAQVSAIDVNGAPALVITDSGRVSIVWTTADGDQVVFGFVGDTIDAVRIARTIREVNTATWQSAVQPTTSNDGCVGLFC